LFLLLGLALGAPPGARAAASREAGRPVTAVILLDSLPAATAVALWRRVLGPAPGAEARPTREGTGLVVRDEPARLAVFRRVLAAVDVPGGASDEERPHIYVRPVVHRPPAELAALLAAALSARPEGRRARFVPVPSHGVLVVSAPPPVYLKLIDPLARRLDVAPPRPPRRTPPAGGGSP